MQIHGSTTTQEASAASGGYDILSGTDNYSMHGVHQAGFHDHDWMTGAFKEGHRRQQPPFEMMGLQEAIVDLL